MKKLLLLGIGSALAFTMGGVGPASADAGPHISTAVGPSAGVVVGAQGAGRCAGCHRAHTAKAEYLLKQAQPALCYTCHASGGTGSSSTDVKNGLSMSNGEALRGGGFDTAAIASSLATKEVYYRNATSLSGRNQVIPTLVLPATTTSKHQIDGVTSGTIWGAGLPGASVGNTGVAGAGITLECGSCHDPHGNGNYRILKPIPVDAGTQVDHEALPAVAYAAAKAAVVDNPLTTNFDETAAAVPEVLAAAAVMSGTAGIKIPDQVTKTYTTTNYWLTGAPTSPATINGTPVASPDGFIANVSEWCSTCHSRYLAKPNSWKTPLKDAAGVNDPTYTYRHTSNRIDRVGTRNCITCHVAHGSNALMSTTSATFTDPGGLVPTTGNSRLLKVDNRGTCVMCHNV